MSAVDLGPAIGFLTSPTVGFLLKLGSGVAAAGFGIFGIGATTRSADGLLTIKGKIALAGIVVAGMLAIGTTIFDFVAGQSAEQAARLRAERLLVSVQRGIYPMRQLRLSMDVSIGGEFEALTAYRAALRKSIEKDRRCEKRPQTQIACSGVDLSTSRILFYEIPRSSPYFPSARSSLGHALRYIEVRVSMYKQKAAGSAGQQEGMYLGRILASWWDTEPPKSSALVYDFETDELSLHVENFPIDDKTAAAAGVYSLIDFMPGFIRATPTVADDPMCLDHKELSVCRDDDLSRFVDGLVLRRFEIAFEYPKRLTLFESPYTACKASKGGGASGLASALPDDIEAIDSLGNITWSKPPSAVEPACKFLSKG